LQRGSRKKLKFQASTRKRPLSSRSGQVIGRCLFICCAIIILCAKDVCAGFVVQVGAFQSNTAASKKLAALASLGIASFIEQVPNSTKATLNLVLAGPYDQASQAESTRNLLAAEGIQGFVRVYEHKSPGLAAVTEPNLGPAYSGFLLQKLAYARVDSNGLPSAELLPAQLAAATTPDSSQAAAPASSLGLPFSISGHVQTALAYTFAQPDHWSKIKNTLQIAIERELTDDIKLKVSGRFSYDGAYDVSNFYPDRVRRDQRFDGMFHETYLDMGLGDWNVRLGRQNIVWGEVVGLFFADVVTAKDLREFLVPEFDYIRIPQWAARTEYFKGDFKAEAIWIPYVTYDRIGKPGGEYYPFTIPPLPGFAQNIRSERTPHSLRDSSFGLRGSYLVNGWDLAGFYYGSMDANATFFRSIHVAPTPTVSYRPDHERIHQAGITASKDAGSFVFKGEAVYTWDRFFSVTRVNDSDGVVRQNFLQYVLSAEVPLPAESRVNVQFFQLWFPNHDRDMIPSRVESGATLLASTKMLNEKVEPELLLINSLNRLDYMARFKINWYFAKDWRFVVGTAVFGGKDLGFFGRFDNRDRVFTELRYTF